MPTDYNDGRNSNREGSRIVDEALVRYPLLPTLTLARTVWKESPKFFPSLNAVSCAIRKRRGAMGEKHRRQLKLTEPEVIPSKFNPLNPLGLPESEGKDVQPFILAGVSKVLVLGDLHLPYHDLPALTAAIQAGQAYGPDCILLNGDVMDCHTLSRFQKNPGARSFGGERAIVRAFLERLRALFPEARIIYKTGNHEDRIESYVLTRAPEFFHGEKDVEKIVGLTSLLLLDELGIELVDHKREVVLGKLIIVHGHELPKGMTNPVNPARGAYLRGATTMVVHHHHRTSEHVERTMDGRIIGCWSSGALCQLRPLYEPNNKWNHGFVMVDVHKDGEFTLHNKKIHKGRLL